MLNTETTHVETQTQIAGPQHIVQIGHMGKLLCHQTTVEAVQAAHTVVFTLEIGLHETDIRCQVLKQRTCKRSAEHGDTHIRVLHGQRIDHRHHHRNITEGGETYD